MGFSNARIISVVALILLLGGILLQFLVILSGATEHSPLNRVYFLQADTTGISGAQNPTRWTFFALCGVVNGRNGNCGPVKAALPFDPPRNFGTQTGVPSAFVGTHYYYYMSRFAFAFFIMALFFAVCALATAALALCLTRVGSVLSVGLIAIAWFFQTLATGLMTVWSYKGRNRFRTNNQSARLGSYAYGFAWGAVTCFTLCVVLYMLEFLAAKRSVKKIQRRASTRSRSIDHNRGSILIPKDKDYEVS